MPRTPTSTTVSSGSECSTPGINAFPESLAAKFQSGRLRSCGVGSKKGHREILRPGSRHQDLSFLGYPFLAIRFSFRRAVRRIGLFDVILVAAGAEAGDRSNLVELGSIRTVWCYLQFARALRRQSPGASRRNAHCARRDCPEGPCWMGFGRSVGLAALALAAAAAYGVYAPEVAERWAPPIGGYARQLHARLWTAPAQTAAAPSGSAAPSRQSGGPAPIMVSVTPVKRADFPCRPRGPRTGSGLQHRARAGAGRRPDRQDRLQGRPNGQGGRSAGSDRTRGRSRPLSIRQSPRRPRTRPISPTPSST